MFSLFGTTAAFTQTMWLWPRCSRQWFLSDAPHPPGTEGSTGEWEPGLGTALSGCAEQQAAPARTPPGTSAGAGPGRGCAAGRAAACAAGARGSCQKLNISGFKKSRAFKEIRAQQEYAWRMYAFQWCVSACGFVVDGSVPMFMGGTCSDVWWSSHSKLMRTSPRIKTLRSCKSDFQGNGGEANGAGRNINLGTVVFALQIWYLARRQITIRYINMNIWLCLIPSWLGPGNCWPVCLPATGI